MKHCKIKILTKNSLESKLHNLKIKLKTIHIIESGIIILTFVLAYILSYKMFKNDFFNEKLILFAEKARLAINEKSLFLENTEFVYPVIPIYLFIIFKYPYLIQAIVGSLIMAILIHLSKNNKNLLILIPFLYLHFGFLYLFSIEFHTLLFFLISALVAYILFKYFQQEYSLYLFTAALLNGCLFFINFSSLLLTFYYLPIFLLKKDYIKKRISLIIVFIFPMIFFFFSYSYLNYLFKGDFFYYWKVMPIEFYYKPEIKNFIFSLLGVLPYILGFFLLEKGKLFYIYPLVPWLIFNFISFPDTTYLSLFSYSIFYLFFFIFFFPYMRQKISQIYLMSLFLINSLFSFFLIHNYGNIWEKNFYYFLMGNGYIQNLKEARNVAKFIDEKEGKFLLNDKIFYKEVYFVKDLKKLLFPYTYFYQTNGNVNYVLIKKNTRNDLVNLYFNDITKCKLDREKFYGKIENTLIFNCK